MLSSAFLEVQRCDVTYIGIQLIRFQKERKKKLNNGKYPNGPNVLCVKGVERSPAVILQQQMGS